MNNQPMEPVSEAMAPATPKRRRYIPRKACLAVIFAAPLAEECLCRGWMFTGLARRSIPLAYAVTAISHSRDIRPPSARVLMAVGVTSTAESTGVPPFPSVS